MKWGIGKKLIIFTFLYFLILSFIVYLKDKRLITNIEKFNFMKIIGFSLVIFGLYLYIRVFKKIKKHFNENKLLKEGAYRVVRHPIYSIWSFLIVPGIALILNNLLYYSLPVFLLILTLILIRSEESELESKFGEEYYEYKRNVPLIFPNFDSITGVLFYPEFTKLINNELYIIKEKYANFFIYKRGETYIAIDSGIGSKIGENELKKLNIPLDKVKAIFFTHSDFDHIDGRKFFPNAELYFCKGEEKIIRGEKPRFLKIIYVKKKMSGYRLLKDGEIIKIQDTEIKAINTPGHTTGHCSYIIDNKYLFTGDLIRIKEGKIYPFYRLLSYNHKDLLISYDKIKKIIKNNSFYLLTAHHGIYKSKIL